MIAPPPTLAGAVKVTDAELDELDTFDVNDSFASQSRHIKVPLILDQAPLVPEITGTSGDVGDTGAGIHQVIEEDRKHLIEAALVRVMKSKRQLGLQELVLELTKLFGSRFVPSGQMIKDRIDNLVDREYIARDNDDINMYYYVA